MADSEMVNSDITVGDYIKNLSPIHPSDKESDKKSDERWTLMDWLCWPPDIFAITSMVLLNTGAYRYTVDPPVHLSGETDKGWPTEENWTEQIREAKQEWIKWIMGERDQEPEFFEKHIKVLENAPVTIYFLKRLNSGNLNDRPDDADLINNNDQAWAVCRSLLFLHALADETCAGFGTPSGILWTGLPDNHETSIEQIRAFHCIANALLARTGSLSRLPRSFAHVLPKLRTPRVGLTLRSLSHHLTFHQTEVDILWRAMPWINIDNHTINALIVPIPFSFRSTWFRPSPYTTPRASSERDSFFEYRGPSEDEFEKEFSEEDLFHLLTRAKDRVNRVHMIVFPELALTEDQLGKVLKSLLYDAVEVSEKGKRVLKRISRDRDKIPMVLAGVREGPKKEGTLGRNKAVLATFFAGKWYRMEQDKQHRWRLDEKQVQQYSLGGVLPANRRWWEAIRLPQRTFTVLAPNGWLGLSTLICEDLARLEPVSELIRGVGPTLLVALLLDGPQLSERWPAKYAGVMADDPGSSVLTVSSLGMSEQSKPLDYDEATEDENKGVRRSVALWRDQVTGSKALTVKQGSAILLTLSAQWEEEISADGRSDKNNAAVFVRRGRPHLLELAVQNGSGEGWSDKRLEQAAQPEEPEQSEQSEQLNEDEVSRMTDLGEITIFTYFVDAALGSPVGVIRDLRDWIIDEKDNNRAFSKLRPRKLLHSRTHRASIDHEIERSKGKASDEQKIEHFWAFVKWAADAMFAIREKWDSGRSDEGDEGKCEWTNPVYIEFLARVVAFSGSVLKKLEKAVEEESFDQPREEAAVLALGQADYETEIPPIKWSIEIPPVKWNTFGESEQHRVVRVYIYGSLAMLWAVYKRLSQFRRAGTLTPKGAELMRNIQDEVKKPHDVIWGKAKAKCKKGTGEDELKTPGESG